MRNSDAVDESRRACRHGHLAVQRHRGGALEELRWPRHLGPGEPPAKPASRASGRCSSASTAGPEAQATVGFLSPLAVLHPGAGHHADPAQCARLLRLRQNLPGAGQRHAARRLGEGHRRAARLDQDPARPGRQPRHGDRRQLRRLHEPGGEHALRRPHRRRRRHRRHQPLRHLPQQHRELPPRPAPRRVRRRAHPRDEVRTWRRSRR